MPQVSERLEDIPKEPLVFPVVIVQEILNGLTCWFRHRGPQNMKNTTSAERLLRGCRVPNRVRRGIYFLGRMTASIT
jgi:hypothetical protein